ncbi:MAG: hypothetical protein AAF914_12075 [Pseudomonadota bacterium]
MRLITAIVLSLAAGASSAQACSPQILSSVIGGMPPGTRNLDPSQLSCIGLTEVYFILTQQSTLGNIRERLQIEAVFRREGLIR